MPPADRPPPRRKAGINKPVGPHTLRHAFITAALDAGVPLRDIQEAASHADPRTTMRYDWARVSLDRHATYIVAAFIADAARCPRRRRTTSNIGTRVYDVVWRGRTTIEPAHQAVDRYPSLCRRRATEARRLLRDCPTECVRA